jgi:CRISPR/Cas system-associated endoribonuclease Cas2
MTQMRRRIDRLIKERQDSVRYYRLCADCRAKIEVTAAGVEVTKEVKEIIV